MRAPRINEIEGVEGDNITIRMVKEDVECRIYINFTKRAVYCGKDLAEKVVKDNTRRNNEYKWCTHN